MPEPDFEQIAADICYRIWGHDVLESRAQVSLMLAEQLRLVWNARGAADANAVDQEARRVHVEASRTGRTDLVVDLVGALSRLDR